MKQTRTSLSSLFFFVVFFFSILSKMKTVKRKNPRTRTRTRKRREAQERKGKVARWPEKFKMRGGSGGWLSILGHRNGTLSHFLFLDDRLLTRRKIMALMPISERNPISTPNQQLKFGAKTGLKLQSSVGSISASTISFSYSDATFCKSADDSASWVSWPKPEGKKSPRRGYAQALNARFSP